MPEMTERSLRAVQAWVEARDYRGYDPGDGLTSFLRPLTCGTLLGERILQQLVWKFPFNLRPLVGVVPLESTKGRGFMAGGYARLSAATGDESAAAKARACLAWLEAAREPGHAGPCWGNHFDFSTRGGRIPAHTPTIVWTSLIGHAFLDAHDLLGEPHYLDVAAGACRWVLTLPRHVTADGECLSYTALGVNPVHNANLLGAGLLARTWSLRPEPEFRAAARAAVAYSCHRQRSDGSWWYGEAPHYRWIDSFHTAYNLDSLKRYVDATGDEEFRPHLSRGYDYYRRVFFGADGRPRYYHNREHPVDIQCAAQAIDTFCLFADADAGALPRARLIAEWTIRNMQEPDGHFIHRRYPLLRAATPYFHWGQATMFHALAHLIFQCARRPVATLS
ncbi:MAG: hypothetical protein RLZZ221_1583 [Verrucomicrobiota bacterium]